MKLSGLLFAEEASAAVRHAATIEKTRSLVDNLQRALDSRSIIGAAVGILMNRYTISFDEGFEQLVQISQRQNIKLRELAEQMTAQYGKPASIS